MHGIIVLILHAMYKSLYLSLLLCVFWLNLSGQISISMSLPLNTEQCQGLPVEIRITNEGKTPARNADIQFFTGNHLTFRPNSLTGSQVSIKNQNHPSGPQFQLSFLDICETTSFQFWMDHVCSAKSHADSFYTQFNWNGINLVTNKQLTQIYSPQISIANLGLYYDEVDKKFKKKYSIVNIGQVALDSFTIFVVGDDKMSILNSNLGTLSPSGDTLFFNPADFTQIGNFNEFFERGESMVIIQEVNLNACETEFKINHKFLVSCGKLKCEFSVQENVNLLVPVGIPALVVVQDTQIFATPCKRGEANLRISNFSNKGSFELGNSMFDLFINLGWSLIQNGQYTAPLKDDCLKITEIRIAGKLIPITQIGFTGYGFDFRRLTTDPDGPGGLDDLDGDGYYDDLRPNDTLDLKIKYALDPSCLNFDCDGQVFDRRTMKLEAGFNNYCDKPGTYEGYVYNQSYYWNQPSVSTLRFQSVYVDEEKDTIQFYLYKNQYHFLDECTRDSATVRITLPPSVELLPGTIITINGNPTPYRKNANVIYLTADTSNFIVGIPLKFHCDPSSGSGGVNTNCTFCLGSGGPRYNIRIEADYFCGDGCYQKIPLYCGSTPAFPVICDTTVIGTNSPGQLSIGDISFKRLTVGYTDSTKAFKVNPETDSLNHNYLFTNDTFLMYIPVDVLCNANFSNILFKLAIAPLIYYVNGKYDTVKQVTWLTDTLKYFDGETNRWSTCINPLGADFYSQATNNYYHYFLRQLNMSALFGTCLNGTLTTRDSMVFVLKGVINPFEITQWLKSTIYADLTYTQDGCNMQVRKAATINTFSGKPSVGSTFLRQDYYKDPNFKGSSPYLSVCGNFRLETSLDSYGSYPENSDPFLNEFRNTYLIDQVKIVIPPFFKFLNNVPNYAKVFRVPSPLNLAYDTSYLAPFVWDSAGYTMIQFDQFNLNQDFELFQHQLWFDLQPECYVSLTDTIRIFKKFKYNLHLPDQNLHKDLYNETKYAINISGVEPAFPEIRKQILKDTLITWPFNLSSKTTTAKPSDYFTYKNLWLLVENSSGQILVDSLIEYDSLGIATRHIPLVINPQNMVFKLDTIYSSRNFKLFTRFNDCHADSLVIYSGNSCAGYPNDFLNISGTCKEYVHRSVLNYEPEDASIRMELIKQPLDTFARACDSFNYSVLVFNSGLGHSFNNRFHFTKPNGLNLQQAFLEYPKDSFRLLPAPLPTGNANEYYWEISEKLFPLGFPGFYRIHQNQYLVHLDFTGDCALEDGQSLSFYSFHTNVCNEYNKSPVVSSRPFRFNPQGQTLQDLYDASISFDADSACGDKFKTRVVLYSKDGISNAQIQKVYFVYAKELSFLPGSFRPIRHVPTTGAGFYYLDGMESVEVPVQGPVTKGDSVVFELELERTCIEHCKTTDFKLILNSPKKVSCTQAPGGECDQLLHVQEWEYKDIPLSPILYILNSDVRAQFLPGGNEQLEVDYLIQNKSPFTGKIDYLIKFYFDGNGNGILDSTDLLISNEKIPGNLISSNDSIWIHWKKNVPGNYSCRMIAAIHPLDNPCLCNGDTLLLSPAKIFGESQIHRICFDQKIQVGFDSIGSYSYQWLQPDRLSTLNSSFSQYQYPGNVPIGKTTWDTLLLKVEKYQSCAFYDTVFVELYRLDADLKMLDSIRCHGDANASIEAKGIGTAPYWSYRWQNSADTSARLSGLGIGTYVVQISDPFGCTAKDSITITQPDSLSSKISILLDYNGYSVSCFGAKDGAVKIEVQGGTPVYSYVWKHGTTGNTAQSLGKGWIKVEARDKNNCPIVDSIFLTEPPPMRLDGGATPAGCDELHGGIAFGSAAGGVGPYRFIWDNGQSSDTIRALKSGRYKLRILDANNCWVDTILQVDQLPDPDINLNITDSTILYGSSVRLSASTNALNPNFLWSPSQFISCDSCSAVVVSPKENTRYEVTVIDEFGCTRTAYININIKIEKKVWVPNVFSPNGDDVNDKFTIYGNPALEEIEVLQIYDRWGELVFEGHDFPPNNPAHGWDGTFRNNELNPEVFVYVATVRFVDGELKQLYGDVTLVK
jgi:gliding motility-associated-like protein